MVSESKMVTGHCLQAQGYQLDQTHPESQKEKLSHNSRGTGRGISVGNRSRICVSFYDIQGFAVTQFGP